MTDDVNLLRTILESEVLREPRTTALWDGVYLLMEGIHIIIGQPQRLTDLILID